VSLDIISINIFKWLKKIILFPNANRIEDFNNLFLSYVVMYITYITSCTKSLSIYVALNHNQFDVKLEFKVLYTCEIPKCISIHCF